MHAHVRNPKQRVELQQKPQLESSTRGAAGGSSRLRAERLACASHCTPRLSRRSSSSVVRASLARSATSIAALPRARRFAHWFNLLGGRGHPPQTPPSPAARRAMATSRHSPSWVVRASFARSVRNEHRRLGAMPRLASVDGRRSTTTRERRRLLFNRCLRRSTTAVRSLRSERRLERGRGSGLGKGKV